MKMITLPKLRDALRDVEPRVKVPADIAERARMPIERMVAIARTGGASTSPLVRRSRIRSCGRELVGIEG